MKLLSNIRLAAAVVGLVQLSLFAQIRQTADDPGQRLDLCAAKLSVVQTQIRELDALSDRQFELLRLANEQERERLTRFFAEKETQYSGLVDRFERLRNQYATLQSDVAAGNCPLCPTRIDAFCSEAELLAGAVGRLMNEVRTLIGTVREQIATARRVGYAIRMTDEAMTRAARITRGTGEGEDAFPALRRAYELQEEAKQAFAAHRFDAAMKLTLKSRNMIGESLRAALDSADVAVLRERARQYYRRTDEMIARAQNAVDAAANPKAGRLLDIARRHQEQAKTAMENDRPDEAVRHARAARKVVVEMAQFYARMKHVDERIGRLQGTIDETRQIIEESGNGQAQRVLDKAVEHFEKAKQAAANGQDRAATAEFDIASKLAARAVDMTRGSGRPALDREIERTLLIVNRAAAAADSDEAQTQTDSGEPSDEDLEWEGGPAPDEGGADVRDRDSVFYGRVKRVLETIRETDETRTMARTAEGLAGEGFYREAAELLLELLPDDRKPHRSMEAVPAAGRPGRKPFTWRVGAGGDYYHYEDIDTALQDSLDLYGNQAQYTAAVRASMDWTPDSGVVRKITPAVFVSDDRAKADLDARFAFFGGLVAVSAAGGGEKHFGGDFLDSSDNVKAGCGLELTTKPLRRPWSVSVPVEGEIGVFRDNRSGYSNYGKIATGPGAAWSPEDGGQDLRIAATGEYDDFRGPDSVLDMWEVGGKIDYGVWTDHGYGDARLSYRRERYP